MRHAAFFVVSVLVASSALAAPRHEKHDKVTINLQTSTGTDAGTATFEQRGPDLEIILHLKNLPTGPHGVHIHQVPKCDAPDFKTAGGHFNPEMKQHGFDNPLGHHAGDLPQNYTVNLDTTDTSGQKFKTSSLSMGTGAANDILANGGTAIIVHEKADDMKTDPSGASGNRIACGVISSSATPTPPAN